MNGHDGLRAASLPSSQRGFTFIVVLILIALIGAGLATAGTVWRTQAQREREEELLFVGQQFRAAIESYVKRSPGAPEFPRRLEDLVEDRRGPVPLRHLRRLYVDPMTGTRDWGLVRQGDRIVGVHTRHVSTPYKTAGFRPGDEAFESAGSVSDWRFVFRAADPAPVPAGAAPGVTGVPGAGSPPMPADMASPDAGVPSPSAPPPPPTNRQSDAACDDQRTVDLAECAALRQTGATPNVIGQCNTSATARYFACARRQPIPPLRRS